MENITKSTDSSSPDNLTNGMIRLSEQISALHHNRVALRSRLALGRTKLENTVSEMLAGFHRDREEMAEKTRAEVANFMIDFMGARVAWSGSAADGTPSRVVPAAHLD